MLMGQEQGPENATTMPIVVVYLKSVIQNRGRLNSNSIYTCTCSILYYVYR